MYMRQCTVFLRVRELDKAIANIPNEAVCEGGLGSSTYMQIILSSAPEARYRPFGEKRTEWMVPRWWLIWHSCLGFRHSGSDDLKMASVDHTRTWPSKDGRPGSASCHYGISKEIYNRRGTHHHRPLLTWIHRRRRGSCRLRSPSVRLPQPTRISYLKMT